MSKAFPTDMSAATLAVGDFFMFADISDSSAAKKITAANLFAAPPDNAMPLGGASNGYTSLYLTDGTAKGVLNYAGNVLQIGSTTDHSVAILRNNAVAWTFASANLLPAALSSIGADSTTTALSAIYLSDGTTKGKIDFSGSFVRFGSTTNHAVSILFNNADALTYNGTALYPQAGGKTLGTDSSKYAFAALRLTDGTARGSLLYESNVLQIGSTTDHGVDLRRNSSNVIRLKKTTDGDNVPFLAAADSAPADGDLDAAQIVFWLDEGSHNLKARVKYSGGTLKTMTVAFD